MYELKKIKNEFTVTGFYSIYYFEFTKDFTHVPESHDFWEMVYVDNGEIIAVTDGVSTHLSQGQVIFHEPNDMHAHISDQKVPNNMLVISFSVEGEAMEYFKKKIFTLDSTEKTLLSLFIKEAQKTLGKFRSFQEKHDSPDFSNAPFGATQLLSCYLTEFLIKLYRAENPDFTRISTQEENRTLTDSSVVELVKNYLASNVYSTITLPLICDKFSIGKSQLCKLFRDDTGQSPIEYYHTLRLNEAKRLLRTKTLSVSQISDLFGYSSIHNFSRSFKKATGFSPKAYIASIK